MDSLQHRSLWEHDYALINPLQVDSKLWSDLPAVALVPDGLEESADLMPRLLLLTKLGGKERIALLDRAKKHENFSNFPYFSSLIASKEEPTFLAACLRRQLVARFNKTKVFFRYFDPRVFKHLEWILSDAQLSALLYGVETWTWRDELGKWCIHNQTKFCTYPRFRLLSEQWDQVKRIHLINQVVAKIEDASNDIVMANRSISRLIDELLVQASENYNLINSEDRCLYAYHGVIYGTDIFRHPEFAARLARTKNSEQSYIKATRDLDPAMLKRFAHEICQPQGAVHV